MIYNFNSNLWWASSGIEYAELYRDNIFKKNNIDTKYIFTEFFSNENIQRMSRNIGYMDSDIIWLYNFFTDTKIAPCSYTIYDFEKTIPTGYSATRNGKIVTYTLKDSNNTYFRLTLTDEDSDDIVFIDIVANGCLLRKDYYSYCKFCSEYFAVKDNAAKLYSRRYFNEDGSIAFEEVIEDKESMYRFPDGKIIYGKKNLIGKMVREMNITNDDIIIMDRCYDNGQAIFENANTDKIVGMIHADHYTDNGTDDDNILWNNFYEYQFANYDKIKYFVCATEAQKELLEKQFKKYKNADIKIIDIPVGSIDKLKKTKKARKANSLITASRLAPEKHVDWAIEAVVMAHRLIPDITFDIYGDGGAYEDLKKLIKSLNAESYITLKGQHNLDNVYTKYDAYISGSTSEGFGLSLMEAVASGLPIIGFDVRYGNQTFINDEVSGFKMKYDESMEKEDKVKALYDGILSLFNRDIESFREESYKLADKFLTRKVEKKWLNFLKMLMETE